MKSRPIRTRLPILLFVFVLTLAGLSACGGDSGDPNGTKTYSAHGITFDFPANWKQQKLESKTEKAANAQWDLEGLVLTEDDVISVQAYQLTLAITSVVFDENRQDIVDEVVKTTAGHDMLADPEVMEVAGLPAITYRVAATSARGRDVTSQLYFVFKDDMEYFINCQATDKRRDDVDTACQKVVESLAIR